jgi:hypothetical protein
MVQGKCRQEKPDQGQHGTRNLERTDAQEETTDTPRRRQGNKGPRQQTATIFEEGEDNSEQHQRVELRTAITSGKWKNTLKDLM